MAVPVIAPSSPGAEKRTSQSSTDKPCFKCTWLQSVIGLGLCVEERGFENGHGQRENFVDWPMCAVNFRQGRSDSRLFPAADQAKPDRLQHVAMRELAGEQALGDCANSSPAKALKLFD